MIEDRDERMELPGFPTPQHPREEDRIFAQPGGEVIVPLDDRFPVGKPMPDYRIYLSREYGRFIVLDLVARSGQVTETKNADDTMTHTFKLQLDVTVVFPGTYRLRALVNGKEVFSRSLTVLNHPALP